MPLVVVYSSFWLVAKVSPSHLLAPAQATVEESREECAVACLQFDCAVGTIWG